MDQEAKAVGAFGRKLRRVLRSKRGWKILEHWDCGWTDGGCLVLAKALRLWLGCGKVSGVWEGSIQHHAVLSVGQWIIDGDGISAKRGFARLWGKREGYVNARLGDFNFDVAVRQGVKGDCGLEKEVVSLLDSNLDDARVRMALTA